MKSGIYGIKNRVNDKIYVGQTYDFQYRWGKHKTALRSNTHSNKKLQFAWNKYGENNFIVEKIQYDNISKEELNNEEIKYIKQYDSYNNGYNLTIGGDGGDTRSKLNFEQFCFAYFGNKKYLLCYIPLFGLWLSLMASTPVFCELRYIYGLFTCSPFLVFLPFIIKKEKIIND